MSDTAYFEEAKNISKKLITQFDKDEIQKKYMELYMELCNK
jgi:hypothetical protein